MGETPFTSAIRIHTRVPTRSTLAPITWSEEKNYSKYMKTIPLLAAALGLTALPLAAQTAATQTTVVTSRGTVSAYDPGTRLVLTEPSGPVTYSYAPDVVYRTSSGVVIPEAEYRTRFVSGAPVRVHYVTEGDRRIVKRVVLRDRGDKDDDDDDN